MTRGNGERNGAPPLWSKTVEHVLVAGGRQTLTLEQLEKRRLARLTTSQRSARAVVHHRFTRSDAATVLQRLGFDMRTLEQGKQPVLQARQGDVSLIVVLNVPAANGGQFQCLDFIAPVGQVADGAALSRAEALNRLNGCSRVARGWIGSRGCGAGQRHPDRYALGLRAELLLSLEVDLRELRQGSNG